MNWRHGIHYMEIKSLAAVANQPTVAVADQPSVAPPSCHPTIPEQGGWLTAQKSINMKTKLMVHQPVFDYHIHVHVFPS